MITLRLTTDIDLLMRWRAEVLNCVFASAPTDELLDANRRYLNENIARGSHRAYIATCDGIDAGCGDLCLYHEMPSPDNPSGLCGYLMNIYIREPYRDRGIATAIVRRLIDDARKLGCGKIYLESTPAAKNLYSRLGFNEMHNYMKL